MKKHNIMELVLMNIAFIIGTLIIFASGADAYTAGNLFTASLATTTGILASGTVISINMIIAKA